MSLPSTTNSQATLDAALARKNANRRAARQKSSKNKLELLRIAGYSSLSEAKRDLSMSATQVYKHLQLQKIKGNLGDIIVRIATKKRIKKTLSQKRAAANARRRARRAGGSGGDGGDGDGGDGGDGGGLPSHATGFASHATGFASHAEQRVYARKEIMELRDLPGTLGFAPDQPFTLTLTSATVADVSQTFNMSNSWHYANWLAQNESDDNMEADSAGLARGGGDGNNAFGAFSASISGVQGGRDNSRAMDRTFETPFYTFSVFDPKSQNNNCGIAVLGSIFGQKMDSIQARKMINIAPGVMLTTDDLQRLYAMGGAEERLVIVTDEFDGDLDEQDNVILFHNAHYYHVKGFERVKLADKKTKRGNLYWDIETRPSFKDQVMIGNRVSYKLRAAILSIVWTPYKSAITQKQTFVSTKDLSCVEMFKLWLTTQSASGKTYNCVSHNGSRFDHYLLYSTFNSNDILESKLQLRTTSMIGLQYKSHLFKDSCCFLVNSLSGLCKSYCTTPEERQYSKIESFMLHGNSVSNTEMCFYQPHLDYLDFLQLENSDPEFWELYVKYCEYDCLSLRIVWEKFITQANSAIDKMGSWILKRVTATSCNTIGSLAKKLVDATSGIVSAKKDDNWLAKSYLRFINNNQEKYQFIKHFKRGGISHCNQPGKHNEGVMGVDITSQYPTAMMKMEIPHGTSRWVESEQPEAYGFYELKDCIFNGNLFKPVAESIKGQSLNWATNTIPCLYADTWMLKYLKDKCNLVSYTVVKGLVSSKFMLGSKLFNKYVGVLYAEKEKQDELKESNDPTYNVAYREVLKLLLNSVSGKMNEDPSIYFKLNFDASQFINKQVNALNNVAFCKDRTDTAEKINEWIVAGVMIYSYSKRLLFEYVNCLPDKSNDVIHVETDGIYFPLPLKDEFLRNLGNYKGTFKEVVLGSSLGSIKIEVESTAASYWLGKKFYYIKTVHKDSLTITKTEYNDVNEIDYAKSKIRIKGIPCRTIDSFGRNIDLVNERFYEDIYKGEKVTTEFSAINKMLFNSNRNLTVELSSYTMSRTTTARMDYMEYFTPTYTDTE